MLHVKAPAAVSPHAKPAAPGPAPSPVSGATPPRPPAGKKDGAGAKIKGSKAGEGGGKGAASPPSTGAVGKVDVRNMMEVGDGDPEDGADGDSAAAERRREHDKEKGQGKEEVEEDEDEDEEEEWLIFNDFLVERTVLDDARGFGPDWKEPCVLVYRRVPTPLEMAKAADEDARRRAIVGKKRLAITPSVFDIAPVSKV